jgi:hypothetical protein
MPRRYGTNLSAWMDQWMNESRKYVCICNVNTIQSSKKGNFAVCNNMDETVGHYDK